MKIKLLKTWLKAPTRKPGDVFELNEGAAEYGIARGLCAPADGEAGPPENADANALQAELESVGAELADTQLLMEDKAERIAELEEQLATAEQAVADLAGKPPAESKVPPDPPLSKGKGAAGKGKK